MDTKNIFTKTFQKKPLEKAQKPAASFAAETDQEAEKVKKTIKTRIEKAAPAPQKRAASTTSMFDSDNIVRAIHKAKEENQRITVDVPMDIYKTMKIHLAHENVSIRDFVVRLIDVYLTKNEIR